MRKCAVVVGAIGLAFALNGCGNETGTEADRVTDPTSNVTASADAGTDFEYVDPDAAYADRIAIWEAKATGPKADYAAKLARQDGWRGDEIAVRDNIVDTCLNLAKFEDGTYTAFYAWTYIFNDVARGNTTLPRIRQMKVASYFIGAACPELKEASKDALRTALQAEAAKSQ